MKEEKRGLRCRVCTGCGLCPGAAAAERERKLHVLAEDGTAGESRPLGGGKRRLAAADIGTTTIAMVLYGEDGGIEDRYLAVNPQTVYGADVLSRIRAAEDKAKAADMRDQVRQVLARGIRRFRKKLGQGESLQLIFAANTTMTYLLQGRDARELGQAPFHASHLTPEDMEIEGADCLGFPGLSAFVGGDILAGVLACGMGEREELTLLLDLGTNGELVLGSRHRRIACATAAGPAFEGGPNRGVWGADMIKILAALKREGFVDGTGLLAEEYFETGIRAGNVLVTQESVRSLQLAKAAVAAGIGLLADRYGTDMAQIDRVVLAGGFGYYLNPWDAAEVGMLPGELAEKAVSGGNTALKGCLAAGRILFCQGRTALQARLEGIAAGTESFNLAEEPDFEESYIRRLNI